MYVRRLKLQAFRNYAELELEPSSGLNVLSGDNAQGKSNLLESIYLLATTRSLRAGRESEMILQGVETASVLADVNREREPDVELEVSVFQTDLKRVRINGVKKPRVLDLLGNLNAVIFASQDLSIVSGEPSIRRRYLNIEISQISPRYVFELANYKKALEQRNRLLRDMRERPYLSDSLEAWNDQLVQHGAPLIEKRRFFLERLAPLADEVHRELTEGREALEIRYLPSVPLAVEDAGASNPLDVPERFRAELKRVGPEESRRGITLAGPQRDEVQFLINGMDARSYSSMGQQRTVVLSLKLAQYRLMEEYVGEAPVMLLDDVMSDLDDRRRAHLLKWIGRGCQTFITCTSLRAFPQDTLASAAIYSVSAGEVVRLQAAGACADEGVQAETHAA